MVFTKAGVGARLLLQSIATRRKQPEEDIRRDGTHPPQFAQAEFKLHWYQIGRVLGHLSRPRRQPQPRGRRQGIPAHGTRRARAGFFRAAGLRHPRRAVQMGLDPFMAEAQTLACFKHPNIVRVLAVFEASRARFGRDGASHRKTADQGTSPITGTTTPSRAGTTRSSYSHSLLNLYPNPRGMKYSKRLTHGLLSDRQMASSTVLPSSAPSSFLDGGNRLRQ